jgi:hypothetical protein
MASVTTRANGSRLVMFTGSDKLRKTITLGQVPAKIAEQVCTRVEYLLAANAAARNTRAFPGVVCLVAH